LNISLLKADIPVSDIVTISVNDEIYYYAYENRGRLNEAELIYYDYQKPDSIRFNVAELVKELLAQHKSIEVYTKLDVINLEKFKDHEERLFILKDQKTILVADIINEMEIIAAVHGNTAGYTYTEELNELDNIWIEDYPIEELFSFGNYDDCNRTLYGIEGNYTKEEKIELKKKIESFFEVGRGIQDYQGFQKFLSALYQENIIMIGFCSC